MQKSESRIPELDGLRASAVLMVVAWHYIGMQGGPESLAYKILAFGAGGVDLFFVLSGFLITRILLNHRTSPNYFSTFYGRRCFRILPIYFLMVGIWLLTKIGKMNDSDLPWWSYIFGIQNFFMVLQQGYGAYSLAGTWSLAVEEQFYLIFPIIVLATPRKFFLPLLFLLIAFCPIGRIISYASGDQFSFTIMMPLRADVLSIGAVVAWLEHYGPPPQRAVASGRLIFWITALAFPIFVFAVGNDGSNATWAYWGHTYLGFLFGSLILIVVRNSGAKNLLFLRTNAATFFAKISYALYLVHGTVFANISHAVHSVQPVFLRTTLLVWLSFSLSILICVLSYRFIEKPMIDRGHHKFKFDPP